MRVVLMGPPGAGKGTQALVVSGVLGVPHIATGDIFRLNIVNGTPLGTEAKRYTGPNTRTTSPRSTAA